MITIPSMVALTLAGQSSRAQRIDGVPPLPAGTLTLEKRQLPSSLPPPLQSVMKEQAEDSKPNRLQ